MRDSLDEMVAEGGVDTAGLIRRLQSLVTTYSTLSATNPVFRMPVDDLRRAINKSIWGNELPPVREALQWDGSVSGATAVIDWVLANGGTARYHDDPSPVLRVNVPDGTVTAVPGDWIIRVADGEFRPSSPTPAPSPEGDQA